MGPITRCSLIMIFIVSFVGTSHSAVLNRRLPICLGPNPDACANCCGRACCAPGDGCDEARSSCIHTPPPPPPPLTDIGLKMQYQQSSQWCWIAVATSISLFYNPQSDWVQCEVMTDVGHRSNHFTSDTSGCPSNDVLNNNPSLAWHLADPWIPEDLYILDNPEYNVNTSYLKTGNVRDPLQTTGNLGAEHQPSEVNLNTLYSEITVGRRPVIAAINWNSGAGQHYVAIAGVSSDSISIHDPVVGTSTMLYNDFPAKYGDGATLLSWVFTT